MTTRLCLLSALLALASVAPGAIPSDVEPRYAAAVLSFQGKDYVAALRQLDEVLARYPKQIEATELRALALTRSGRDAEAATLFTDLLSRASDAESSVAYRFQLGTLAYRKKAWDEAAAHLRFSIDRGFNVDAANYLLGSVEFGRKNWLDSEKFFQRVLTGGTPGLLPASHLYLAEISNLTNDRSIAVFHYFRAREAARSRMGDPSATDEEKELAKQSAASIDRNLGVLDRPSLFGTLGLFTGYDSNVLFTPSGISTPAEGPSGRGTLRTFLSAEIGYATSPMKKLQWIPIYRGSWNYNFNRALRTGEFFVNDLTLIAAYNPLGRQSFGVRLGANGAFRYTLDPSTGLNRYRTYSLVGTFSPYGRWAIGKRWTLGASVTFSPTRFFLDSETSSQFFKTGADYLAEVTLRQDRGHLLWNPRASAKGGIRYTRGTEFRGRGLELEFGNLFYFSDKVSVTAFAGMSSYSFKDRPDGNRFDLGLSLGGTLDYRLNERVTLLANLELLKNKSNVALPYEFTRYLLNLGATYRL